MITHKCKCDRCGYEADAVAGPGSIASERMIGGGFAMSTVREYAYPNDWLVAGNRALCPKCRTEFENFVTAKVGA